MMAERPSSAGKSLDVKLVTDEPDLVMAHLKARHASEEQMSSVADIGGEITAYGAEFVFDCPAADSPPSLQPRVHIIYREHDGWPSARNSEFSLLQTCLSYEICVALTFEKLWRHR